MVNLGAEVSDAELRYTGAGFLAGLYESEDLDPSDYWQRGALASNIAKRAGYATDGKKVGQMWHVL